MARVMKTPESANEQTETVGPAEAQRRALRAKALEELQQAEAHLTDARKTHADAGLMYASAKSPEAFAGLMAAPRAALEQAELRVAHREAAAALYDSQELIELCRAWDAHHPEDGDAPAAIFRTEVEEVEAAIVREAARAIASAIVSMQERISRMREDLKELPTLASKLKEFGVKVKYHPPSYGEVPRVVGLALAEALQKQGLSLHSELVRDALSPHLHYQPPKREEPKSSAPARERLTQEQVNSLRAGSRVLVGDETVLYSHVVGVDERGNRYLLETGAAIDAKGTAVFLHKERAA